MKTLNAIAMSLGAAGCALAQTTYDADFSGDALPAGLRAGAAAGFGVDVTGGACLLTKDAGTTSGGSRVRLCRFIDGDFTATLVGDRSDADGTGSSGLHVNYPGGSFVDIFFYQGSQLNANIFQSGAGARTTPSSAAEVLFRIQRTGETLSLDYDDLSGSGWVTLHSSTSPSLLGPVQVSFFFIEERSASQAATFAYDDLRIEADVIAECFADCDCNVTLDLFDFLCFQNSFAAGDAYADCDGSGVLDFFDFLCFQNAFAVGCP